MTDWLGVATAASAILLGFMKKAGGKIAQETGNEIFSAVRAKLRKNSKGKALLENFKNKPESYVSALTDEIKFRAIEDQTFGRKLEALVQQASQADGGHGISQFAQGNGIAQSAGDGAKASVELVDVPFRKRKRSSSR